jgi:TRAP-type transport system small permease protein
MNTVGKSCPVKQTPTFEDGLVNNLKTIISRLVLVERVIAVALFCLVIVTMGSQVFARYVLHQPFSWSEELARFALVWMAFIASGFVMAEDNHITVDLWGPRISLAANRRLRMFSLLVVVAACLMLMVGGLRFIWFVKPVGSPTLGISKSLWYLALGSGLALMAVHALANFVLLWRTGKLDLSYLATDPAGHGQTEEANPLGDNR